MEINTDSDFIKSMSAEQREYFIKRETAAHERLQLSIRELSRGIAPINALLGETLAVILAQQGRR